MSYRCRACKKEFPVVGRIEVMSKEETKDMGFAGPIIKSTYRTVSKPCCPFCESLEIEEIKE